MVNVFGIMVGQLPNARCAQSGLLPFVDDTFFNYSQSGFRKEQKENARAFCAKCVELVNCRAAIDKYEADHKPETIAIYAGETYAMRAHRRDGYRRKRKTMANRRAHYPRQCPSCDTTMHVPQEHGGKGLCERCYNKQRYWKKYRTCPANT